MKKYLDQFLFLGLVVLLLVTIYGGLSLKDLKNKNINLEEKQTVLENKISDLQNNLNKNQELVQSNQEAIDNNKIEVANLQKNISSYQSQLSYLKNLVETPKEILGESTVINTSPVKSKPVEQKVKTISNYV